VGTHRGRRTTSAATVVALVLSLGAAPLAAADDLDLLDTAEPASAVVAQTSGDHSLLLRDLPTVAAARTRVGDHRAGYVVVDGVRVPVAADGTIDWSDPHRRGRSFQRLLHAHLLVQDLAILAEDGDARAGRLAVAIVDRWVEANPRHRPAHPMAWHDETTAWRTRNLLTLYERVTGTDRDRIGRLLREHVQLLLQDSFHRDGTNHGMFQDRAILAWATSSAASGQLRTTAMATATRRLVVYFELAVSSDGVHLEHSPAYHQVIASNLRRFVPFFAAVGDTATERRLTSIQTALVRYATHVLQPDGTFPLVGDTATSNVPQRNLLDDAGYRFAVTTGREGTAPTSTDAFFPVAGYAIMRDAWRPGPGGTYLHFTAAYHSRYHKHADDLSLWLYHHGELLTEAGAHGYEFGTPMNDYGYGASAHNTVLVDGVGVPVHDGRTDAVGLTATGRSGQVSTATGRTGRLPHGTWRRTVRYDRGAATIEITDVIDLDRSRSVQLLWHTAPGVTPHPRDGDIVLARRGVIAARLRVTSESGHAVLPTVRRASRSPISGWRLGIGTATAVDTLWFAHAGRQPRYTTAIRLAAPPPPPVDLSAVCSPTPSPFTDVSGTHAGAIGCAAVLGIVPTTSPRYEPDRPATRAELTGMLARALAAAGTPLPPVDGAAVPPVFPDLPPGPDGEAVAAMADAGLVEGTTSGTFEPHRSVTRAQTAALLVRTLEHAIGVPLPESGDHFVDVHGVHAPRIRQAVAGGLVAGDGRTGFAPAGTLTRAQAATFVMRLVAAADAAG
jgi:hypothetical protein